MAIIEIIILVIIICAISGIGYLSYNVIKTSIDEKAPKTAVAQVQNNIESTNLKLSQNMIASSSNDLHFKTEYENTVVNLRKDMNNLIDIQSTNYGILNSNIALSNIAFSNNITSLQTATGFLRNGLADIGTLSSDKSLNIGSTSNVNMIYLNKPVRADKLNIGPNWNVREVERALCFYNVDTKVLCLDSKATQPVILYNNGFPIIPAVATASTTGAVGSTTIAGVPAVTSTPYVTGTGITSTPVISGTGIPSTPIIAGGGTTTTTGVVGGLPATMTGVVGSLPVTTTVY